MRPVSLIIGEHTLRFTQQRKSAKFGAGAYLVRRIHRGKKRFEKFAIGAPGKSLGHPQEGPMKKLLTATLGPVTITGHASNNSIRRKRTRIRPDTERSQGKAYHSGQSAQAAKSAECGRAWLEAVRGSGARRDSQASNGRVGFIGRSFLRALYSTLTEWTAGHK